MIPNRPQRTFPTVSKTQAVEWILFRDSFRQVLLPAGSGQAVASARVEVLETFPDGFR